ncbi:MAG: hypothetical protein ABI587_14170 [Gemmatimonadales bacterium]
MSGLGRGLDRSGRVVGAYGDLPRDGSAPLRVLLTEPRFAGDAFSFGRLPDLARIEGAL